MDNLNEEQKYKLITRSREAKAFMGSPLYQELLDWVDTEKRATGVSIFLDRRAEHQKNLTREAFVEQQSGYYLGIQQLLGVIKSFAGQEEQLNNLEKEPNE
jgi:hypothetical protein